MDRFGVQAIRFQFSGQTPATDLRIGKNNRLFEISTANQMRDRRTFLIAAPHHEDLLSHVFCGGISPRHLNQLWHFQKGITELLDLLRKGCREHQTLSNRWEQRENPLQIRHEPHVEHSISLIENDDLNLAQIDVLLAHVIEQAARSRNQDFTTHPQLRDLRLDINATVDARNPQRRELRVLPEIHKNLIRQFSGRCKDEGTNWMACWRRA